MMEGRGVTGTGRLNINLSEGRRSKDTQNLKCVDRSLQNYLVLKTEDLATKQKGLKIWILNCEDLNLKCD